MLFPVKMEQIAGFLQLLCCHYPTVFPASSISLQHFIRPKALFSGKIEDILFWLYRSRPIRISFQSYFKLVCSRLINISHHWRECAYVGVSISPHICLHFGTACKRDEGWLWNGLGFILKCFEGWACAVQVPPVCRTSLEWIELLVEMLVAKMRLIGIALVYEKWYKRTVKYANS